MLSQQYLEQCAERGWSIRKIVQDSGVSKSQIQYWMTRYGINTDFMNRRATNEVLSDRDLKFCMGCKQVKDTNLFAVNRRTKDNLASNCRECEARRIREYRASQKS